MQKQKVNAEQLRYESFVATMNIPHKNIYAACELARRLA